jgi:hypothetical protein
MNLRRIFAVSYEEWREIVRDRLFLTLAFVVPTALMLIFGFGLTLDVEHIPFAVLDHDKSAASRDYLHRYIDSRYFDTAAMWRASATSARCSPTAASGWPSSSRRASASALRRGAPWRCRP